MKDLVLKNDSSNFVFKIPDAQIWNIENKYLNVFQKIILVTNFTNTTHFTQTNILDNCDHCFQKGSGNHYLKLIISANPCISTKFSTFPLIQHVTKFNISKYNDHKENYSRKLFYSCCLHFLNSFRTNA